MKKLLTYLSLPLFAIAAQAAPTPANIIENLHVDQFGYRCGDQKIAVISSAQTGYYGSVYTPGTGANEYQVRRWSDDLPVFIGTLTVWNGGATQTQSGDKAWWFDFSSFSANGGYYIYDVATGKASGRFVIDNQVYKQVLKQAMRTYFYQRCGMAKSTPYAGAQWTDAACHVGSLQDKDCRLYNNSSATTSKDLSGGWHDAGDYNKYVGFTLGALTDLLLAYQENPTVWTDDFGIPESGNGTPDILDEVKYELDWLLKMQQADGSVLCIAGAANTASSSPPSSDKAIQVYGPATTNASFVTANVCALAAIQFNTAGNTAYATVLQNAAINAYNWATAHPSVVFSNSGHIAAGEQEVGAGTYDLFSRQFMAAVYLYKLTGTASYKTFVESNYQNIHLMLWGYAYPFETTQQDALINYATAPGVAPAVKNNIINTYTASVNSNNPDNLPSFTSNKDAYRAYISDQNYTDGSNMTKGHQGLMFTNMVHYNLVAGSSVDYMNAASGFLHYIHGVNPTGFCYLSNMGAYGASKSVPEFYNSWFADGSALWDRVGVSTYGPAPGFVPGGTNPGYSTDGCCVNNSCGSSANNSLCNPAFVTPPLNQPTQKSYKDFNASWPQNSWVVSENGIYYQAAYVKLLSSFIDTSTACSNLTTLAYRLVSFTAAFQTVSTVKTAWTVAAQESMAKYVVQRSADGSRFDSIGALPASSNSQYVFYDNNIHTSLAYYRLKLVDKNGVATLSNTVMVKNTASADIVIYPNPAKDAVTISFNNNNIAGPGELLIKDASGRTVLQLTVQLQAGYNSYTLPVAHFASALYFVSVVDGQQHSLTGKLVKW